MKPWTIVFCLTLAGVMTGCAPSITSLTEMRSIRGDQRALDQQRELLDKFIAGGQPAPWRAEAMNTMAYLDVEFMQGIHHPDLHKRLVVALKSEYIKPKVAANATAEDRYRLRAWSVHALSRLDQPFFLEFYANVLSDRKAMNDRQYLIRLAAVNGAIREKKTLAISKDLRQRIFAACAKTKSEIRFKGTRNPNAAKLGNAITQLEKNLLSYKDAVAMLPHKPSAYADADQFLQVLRWCERGIVKEKAATAYPELYAENIRKLLVLVTQPHPQLRVRVRAMLVQYAPLALLEKLVKMTAEEPKLNPQDLQLALRLMEVLDDRTTTLSKSEKTRYLEHRLVIPQRFFEKINSYSPETQNIVLGRLLGIDVTVFIELTHQYREVMLKAHLKPAQMYLRYLYHAYNAVKPGSDSRRLLTDTICGWVRSDHLPIRRTVTAMLLKSAPERLAIEKTPMFDALKDWDHTATAELVDSYMAALLEIEKTPGRLQEFSQIYKKQTGQGVFAPLAKTLPYRVLPSNQRVAEFLSSRSPELFLTTLSNAMLTRPNAQRSQRLSELILLGDLATEKKTTLSAACRDQVIAALKAGMSPGDADQALLCLRYVLELEGAVNPEFISRQSKAVRLLYNLHKGGQNQ